MSTGTRHLPETQDARRTRQCAYFVELAELNMQAARDAARRIADAQADDPAAAAAPTLDLARATRAVTLAVNAENRILDGEAPLRADPEDNRREPLRKALHDFLPRDPDPARRALIRRRLDERIEFALAVDPDRETKISVHLGEIAAEFDIPVDITKVHDAVLDDGYFDRVRAPPPEPVRDTTPRPPGPYFVTAKDYPNGPS